MQLAGARTPDPSFTPTSDSSRAPVEKIGSQESTQGPLTILVVDDVTDVRDMYAWYFEYVGANVLKAQDGAAALEAIHAHAPDVILLDLAMPRMSGEEMLAALRRDPKTRDIPVVVLTGHAVPGSQEALREAGADLFLTKPCLPHLVFSFILHLMRRRGTGNA